MTKKRSLDRALAVAALGVAAYLQSQAILSLASSWFFDSAPAERRSDQESRTSSDPQRPKAPRAEKLERLTQERPTHSVPTETAPTETAPTETAPTETAPDPIVTSPKTSTTDRIAEAIERDRTETEKAFRRPRFVPERKDGRTLGYRVFGVQPGSVYALLGFENGDRIETINGKSATNPAAMLEVYAGWRRAETFIVKLNRRGAPLELTYNLR